MLKFTYIKIFIKKIIFIDSTKSKVCSSLAPNTLPEVTKRNWRKNEHIYWIIQNWYFFFVSSLFSIFLKILLYIICVKERKERVRCLSSWEEYMIRKYLLFIKVSREGIKRINMFIVLIFSHDIFNCLKKEDTLPSPFYLLRNYVRFCYE
jgi:hypothetical protein